MSKNKHSHRAKERMDKRSREKKEMKAFYDMFSWADAAMMPPETETTFIPPKFTRMTEND